MNLTEKETTKIRNRNVIRRIARSLQMTDDEVSEWLNHTAKIGKTTKDQLIQDILRENHR